MKRKRCPLCGERYPRSALYCDQDGTTLVRGEPRRWRRLGAGLAVAALLALVLLVALPFAAERWLRVQVDVNVVAARFAGGGSDGEGGLIGLLGDIAGDLLGRGSGDLSIELRIDNRTPLPLEVREARYVVRLAGQQVGTGTWTPPAGGRCAAGDHLEVKLTVTPTAEGAAAIARALVAGEPPEVEVSGDLEVELLFARSEVPFNVRRVGLDLGGEDGSSPPAASPPAGVTTAADRSRA